MNQNRGEEILHFQRTHFAIPIVFIVPFLLIVFKPILFPFADDWLIIGWASGTESLGISGLLQTVNGHQIITSKLLLHSLGVIDTYNIQIISLASFILGSCGITLLVYSQLYQIGKRISFVVVMTCLIIGSNYKQMQNYFMPICNGWMLAIFFIGIFYFLKQLETTRVRSMIICSCIVLAPLSIGLGVILPITQLIENAYVVMKSKNKEIFDFMVTSAASVVSLALIAVYKIFGNQDISGSSQSLDISSLIKPFTHPIDALKFLMTLIGSVFVPSSRFEPVLPIIAGLIFSTIFVYFCARNYKSLNINDFLLNRSCLMGGLIYAASLYLFRYTDENNGLIGIAAPRYVTGTMIIVLACTVLLAKFISSNKQLNSIFVFFSICVLITGLKTGLEWHSVRFSQSQEIMKCVKEEEFKLESSCYKSAKESSMTPSSNFFDLELKKFIRGVNSGI